MRRQAGAVQSLHESGDDVRLRPGARTVAAAIADAVRAGSRSFAGAGAATAARYVGRVAAFAAPWANAWDDADGRPVSLAAHFGGALVRWAVR